MNSHVNAICISVLQFSLSAKAHCAKLRQNGYRLTKSGVVGMYSEVQIMRQAFYMMIPLILIMIGPITEANVKWIFTSEILSYIWNQRVQSKFLNLYHFGMKMYTNHNSAIFTRRVLHRSKKGDFRINVHRVL